MLLVTDTLSVTKPTGSVLLSERLPRCWLEYLGAALRSEFRAGTASSVFSDVKALTIGTAGVRDRPSGLILD